MAEVYTDKLEGLTMDGYVQKGEERLCAQSPADLEIVQAFVNAYAGASQNSTRLVGARRVVDHRSITYVVGNTDGEAPVGDVACLRLSVTGDKYAAKACRVQGKKQTALDAVRLEDRLKKCMDSAPQKKHAGQGRLRAFAGTLSDSDTDCE